MNLSLVILKTGVTLVSETHQLDFEPSCHLVDPMTISGKTKLTLTRWPEHTGDSHILLRSEDLLTVCEPNEKLTQAYLKKVGKTIEDLTSEPEPVMLNEQASTDQTLDAIDLDDEYEPNYVETF